MRELGCPAEGPLEQNGEMARLILERNPVAEAAPLAGGEACAKKPASAKLGGGR